MSEREPDKDPTSPAERPADEETYSLSDAIVDEVSNALAAEDPQRVRRIIEPLHYSDVADLVERLAPEDRDALLEIIKRDFDPEVLHELDEGIRDEIIKKLGLKNVAAAVREMDSDDAVSVFEELADDERKQLFAAIPAEDRAAIRDALTYPEDSAGRLMQRELVKVPPDWTVGETIDFMRRTADDEFENLPEVFYDIFVVSNEGKPLGAIPLSRLLRSRRQTPVPEIMETEMQLIPASMDQEEVAFLFRQRDLVSAPVVDEAGRLVGAITVDDVVDVIQKEHEEDFLGLGGVAGSDLRAPPLETAWRRSHWLFVTLINNIIAATVISQFEATIEQMVALAVLMPMVAAMGGNAGTQVVTVVVRGLATKELSLGNVVRVAVKEVGVGFINGVGFALLAGLLAAFWFENAALGAVLGGAMVFNMVWAGLAGTLIPMALIRFRVDPAIAAGPFLTTTTDVLGFFCFLGLATRFLLGG
ncbi:MAG: magnesium transporter [Rhodospirillales bacterium]|nr:magnesium transporter [Rhodospirillales bacterium]